MVIGQYRLFQNNILDNINIFSKQDSNLIELLKWIGIITMVIDHLAILFFDENVLMRIVGRVSMPIFAYILIHNYIYFTRIM